MNRRYILNNVTKNARTARLIAKGIDFFIILVLAILVQPIGILMAIIYMSVCDSLMGGSSVGKKLLGFRVISLEDGAPCRVQDSFIRNLPFIIPLFLAVIPFWGWIFAVIIGVPLTLVEVYLLLKLDSGYRLGDVMAETSVLGHDNNKELYKQKRMSWFNQEPV